MALNCEWAREALERITKEDKVTIRACIELETFINDVEQLMINNSIKQTPALFKPKEKGS